jgi:hypothetical protein
MTDVTPGPWIVRADVDGRFLVAAAYDDADLLLGRFDKVVARELSHADALFIVDARTYIDDRDRLARPARPD